ncbi:hypothetical protein TorRG33x02_325650 [Trema orientale]|uniref:Uncharacterized protein n=1 Tax=Trema orientale TaxID=63057 RepID=A0A2P5BCJ7_TREOI|nr:hypothetical protein TorRG33x02_325650 [Trema orientale]
MLLHFVNVRFLPVSLPSSPSDSPYSFQMSQSVNGDFPTSLISSDDTHVIDLDTTNNSGDQSMAGFPSMSEIKRNPNTASELFDHITFLDEQLITLQNKTKEEVAFYKSHIAALQSYSENTSKYIADIESFFGNKIAKLEANLLSTQTNLQAAYQEIARWKSLYFDLKDNMVTIPVLTRPSELHNLLQQQLPLMLQRDPRSQLQRSTKGA